MCEFNTKITIVQLSRLTILSAKSKIHSLRWGYLSPGNSIALEIESALLFISVTNSCWFWGSFVQIQAHFQQTCIFTCFTQLFSGAAVKWNEDLKRLFSFVFPLT